MNTPPVIDFTLTNVWNAAAGRAKLGVDAAITAAVAGVSLTPGPAGPAGPAGPVGPSGGIQASAGRATVNFGTFPGTREVTTTVTGLSAIRSNSCVLVWVAGATTADHSVAEHYLEEFIAFVTAITPGTGFSFTTRPAAGFCAGRYQLNYLYV